MPAPRVPSTGQTSTKWARRSATAGPEYEDGVKAPRTDWAQAATAQKGAYQQGVTAAISRDAYAKGINAAGTARWQQKAIEKGPARFAQGVAVSQGDYEKAVAPYLEAIGRVDLPPRGPRGSEQNYNRIAPIGKALAAIKRR